MLSRLRIRPNVVLAGKRMMSGDVESARVEHHRWYQITLGMLAISGIMTAYNMATMEHEHQEVQGLSYMKIRNKPFPWKECPNCDLIDSACWKECREAKNN